VEIRGKWDGEQVLSLMRHGGKISRIILRLKHRITGKVTHLHFVRNSTPIPEETVYTGRN
jgi:hypothetical protein